jgi:putative membrane protein insertion efficiency factor
MAEAHRQGTLKGAQAASAALAARDASAASALPPPSEGGGQGVGGAYAVGAESAGQASGGSTHPPTPSLPGRGSKQCAPAHGTCTSFAARAIIALVRLYQCTLGPLIGGQCRFAPTCSHYAIEALSMHGAFRGAWLTLRRLLRCHPFGGSGHDPVPTPPRSRT